jgi:hypothetical protein
MEDHFRGVQESLEREKLEYIRKVFQHKKFVERWYAHH